MKPLKPVFNTIRRPLKRAKVYIKQKAGWLGIPKILPYRGYGDYENIYIQGMVIEDSGLTKPEDRQKVWQNILATLKRFSSDEIAGVRVKAEFLGLTEETETDEHGFFSFHFRVEEIENKLLEKDWHEVSFELMDRVVEDQPETRATGEVRIVSPGEGRVIVSDIDDTVLISHSTQTLRKLRLMLFKNALSRLPFKGVSWFYNALEKGPDKKSYFPFFYVSSSEWNLYDLLEDFFAHNKIPRGVFMLRKLESSIYKFWKSGQGNHEHKYDKIKALLNYYKTYKFILIGDSGQRDPLIYKRLALEFPGRIEAIYIRKIGSGQFFKDMDSLHKSLKKAGTTYLQVEDTLDAARHAMEHGFIHEDYLREMAEKKEEGEREIVEDEEAEPEKPGAGSSE